MIKPDTYDLSKDREFSQHQAEFLGRKAQSLFSKSDVFNIFAKMGGSLEDVEILRKYDDFSRLSGLDERKDVYLAASATEKSNYWRTHLAHCLAKFYDLNIEQKRLIVETIDFATPEIFAISRDTKEWQTKVDVQLQNLSSRIFETFTKEMGLKIFLTLGDGEPSSSVAGRCECALDSIPSCWDMICQSWSCSVSKGGCGVFWLSDCNGRCPSRP